MDSKGENLEGFAERVFVPDDCEVSSAAERVTHMGIGAHQDDLEIFAYHGIAACYQREDRWFGGVTVTDGGGSARTGPYADFSDEQMKALRVEEQNEAARLGQYGLQAQLGYSSAQVKDGSRSAVVTEDLFRLLSRCRPEVLYLHNPADKHDTHVAVLQRCLEALGRMPAADRPKAVYGCEVWRDLDWMIDADKIALEVDAHPDLAKGLIEVFRSQVVGGKDYVAATLGRRRANATYFDSRSVDGASAVTFAMDLRPLLEESPPSLGDFLEQHIERFRRDCEGRLRSFPAQA